MKLHWCCIRCGKPCARGLLYCDDCRHQAERASLAWSRPPPRPGTDPGGRTLAACLLLAVLGLALWYALYVHPHDRGLDALAACADSRAEPGTPGWRAALDDCQRAARGGTALSSGSVWSHPDVTGVGEPSEP